MKVLFLIPYPLDEAPSQRFRFEQYFQLLRSHGIQYHTLPYLDQVTWKLQYRRGHQLRKIWGYFKGYLMRIKCLFSLDAYQWIFVHREITPLGPAWMAWWIAKIAGKKIIYDFDDALWLRDHSKVHPAWSLLKSTGKVKTWCRYSYRVSCGNHFLAEFASRFSPNVAIIPTTIDTDHHHLPNSHQNQVPVIGWTGSHSTLPYLELLRPVLIEISHSLEFKFKVICDRAPEFDLPNMIFVPWSKEKEISELNGIDIGVMPLDDRPWSQGKCGFKILQYMALEKAAVASGIGVNNAIIEHGLNGLLCHSREDWIKNLRLLLTDEEQRIRLGKKARITVIKNYSVRSNEDKFLSLFRD